MFPAGHVIGSAQIRLEYKGEICVVSGDYKVEFDGISTPFEPVKCHTFVSESTFGLPIYKWQPQNIIFNQIRNWVSDNRDKGKTSVLVAYSLGKAQRLIKNLAEYCEIYVHNSIANLNEGFVKAGVDLPDTIRITPELKKEALQWHSTAPASPHDHLTQNQHQHFSTCGPRAPASSRSKRRWQLAAKF
eukprot:TRINITY_DN3515_c1_g1_i1.p1 TRINITY_DN3515_c1_g1~~TRINITY_DN3515_c1_g1_i1.p1  ORF type:complete len:188 (+),score=12.26 TRINITY_DN3515_c1_g1_i1:263-826(+)